MISRRGFIGAISALACATSVAEALPSIRVEPIRQVLNLPPLEPGFSEFGLAFEVTEELLEYDGAMRQHVDRLVYSARHVEERVFKNGVMLMRWDG